MSCHHRALARLELRRVLTGGTTLAALSIAILLTLGDWTPEALRTTGEASAAVSRGLSRRAIWSGALLFLAPALVLHASGIVARWRRGEGDWIGSRPTRPWPAIAAVWAGAAAGALSALVALAAIVETRAGLVGTEASPNPAPSERVLRLAWRHALADFVRLEPGERLSLALEPPRATPAGARLAVALAPSYGAAPTTDVELSIERAGTRRGSRARVAERGWYEVEIEPGTGPFELDVHNAGTGALVIVAPESVQLWVPSAGAWRASATIATHAGLALAALMALTLGFAAWVSPITAALGTLATWVAGVGVLGAPWWFPGAGLPSALESAATGRLPASVGASAYVASLVAVAFGLALTRPGVRSWRPGP